MPSREEAIRLLRAAGETAAAEHVRTWRNRDGTAGGWDANLKLTYPAVHAVLWPDEVGHVSVRGTRRPREGREPLPAETPRLVRPVAPAFDAYVMIDWSANSIPKTGRDSIWCACLEWEGAGARISSSNPSTRAELVHHVRSELTGRLHEHRTLVGFDFPFGFPSGFAAALGHVGPVLEAWNHVWQRLSALVVDGDDNDNNRLCVAAKLNRIVSGGFGPFYGRPASVSPRVAETLSPKQLGAFAYPLRTLTGHELARQRVTDRCAGTKSSPWFVYGGGNSVGGQALVGIPRVRELRAALGDARVWPFETGASLPDRTEARVILTEVYPSLFHTRAPDSLEVHDKLQVEAAVTRFATMDAAGAIGSMFAAPPLADSVLGEEGWVLGGTSG